MNSIRHWKLHARLHLLLYFCTMHTSASSYTGVPCFPADAAALLQLKRSFLDPNLTSWRAGTNCCRWEGVACDLASGRAIALDLGGRNLQSQRLDPALFNLTSLKDLSLADNDFMLASLPSFGFELLTEMVHLDFSNTNFVGQIPIGIARLRKLVTLDLSCLDSSLFLKETSIETLVANFSSLRELQLDGVDMSRSGKIWSIALANSTPRLQILSLSSCRLSGSIHHSFSRLRSLVEIYLRSNAIAGKVPEFLADFPLLSKLDLSYNDFEGQFPTKIFQLKNLSGLFVSDNPRLSGDLPSFPIENKLEMLSLYGINFSDAVPMSIVNLKSLRHLELWTEGTSKKLSLIANLPSLDVLMLRGSSGLLEKPQFSWIANLRHLTALEIFNYRFCEPIPSWIANLTNLAFLHLYSCNFYGSIPPWIGNMTQLNSVDLHENCLTGKIPRNLFTLPGLQLLSLSSNQLSSQLEDIDNPLSSSLIHIDLKDNHISGSIPDSYLRLTNLQVLFLGSNKLTGTLDLSSLRRLKNLDSLDLSNNMLSVIDGGDSASLPKINHLGLASCNLAELPSMLRYQDKIEVLDLSNNHISGVIPSWVWENWKGPLYYLNLSYNMFTSLEKFRSPFPMPSLHFLDMSSNRLEGNVPIPNISKCAFGTVLDYSNNLFSSILPEFGTYLGETTYLDLSNNKLSGHIPTSICSASELQSLYLCYNNFTGLIPSCLAQRNLRELKVRGNQVNGVLHDSIKQGCMLKTIDLNSNYIVGKLPRSLSNCRDLALLDVGNNQIVDSFPSWMGYLPKLQVLVLRSNRFFGMITYVHKNGQKINYFSSLQILDLASNNFFGHLPQGWFIELKSMMANDSDEGQVIGHQMNTLQGFYQDTATITFKGLDIIFTKILTTFKAIDFSNNSFGGPIPVSIGRLISLHGLNMSYNNFTGTIPPQLANLTRLESLDLSWNHLSGELPQELTSLTSLAWLNLSYNNLTGRIPQGNQFLSFPNSSFEGNPGLCGSQVSKQCDNSGPATPRTLHHQQSNSLWKDRREAILLFTFIGLGFGVGFALAIMFMIFCCQDGLNSECLCVHMQAITTCDAYPLYHGK